MQTENVIAGKERKVMTSLGRILPWLFECHHRELSRVFTINKRTYQVCFNCGLEIDYSWDRMASLESNMVSDRPAPMNGGRHAQVSII
jgi:hypothetical protein